MKTTLHQAWVCAAALSALLTIGCKENAKLGWPVVAQIAPAGIAQASPSPQPAEPGQAAPQNETPKEAQPAPPAVEPAGGMPLPPTNRVALAPARLPAAPENVKLSTGLEEIIKMAQAGISEEVMLSYITNSANVYHLTSNEIVYLNDMGISTPVITALIEKDNTPQASRLKKDEVAVAPLPPGAALSAPATNIYPSTTPKSDIVQVPKYPDNVDYGIPASQLPAAEAPLPENVTTYAPDPGQELPAQVSDYYTPLAPYGNWYYVPSYGYCWRPTVAVVNYNWRPYCDGGRWLWSTRGWYWYSDYSWGWAPFHYGRWTPYPSLGWVWVPDNCWGPSWVSWRTTRYHCGWAPLPPYCNYVSGFGLYYNSGSVGFSFGFGYGYQYYSFLPYHRFCDKSPHHYYASRSQAQAIYNQSTVVNNYIQGDNNTIINQGVGLERVASVSRSDIPTVQVRETPANFDAQGRRERLISNGNAVSVTSPAPPPGATSAAGMRARSVPPAAGAAGTGSGAGAGSAVGTPGSSRLAPDRAEPAGRNRSGLSAVPPSSPDAQSSSRPSTRLEAPNRRNRDSSPGNRPIPPAAQTGAPSQAAASTPGAEAPRTDLAELETRGRAGRAQSDAIPRGNAQAALPPASPSSSTAGTPMKVP